MNKLEEIFYKLGSLETGQEDIKREISLIRKASTAAPFQLLKGKGGLIYALSLVSYAVSLWVENLI